MLLRDSRSGFGRPREPPPRAVSFLPDSSLWAIRRGSAAVDRCTVVRVLAARFLQVLAMSGAWWAIAMSQFKAGDEAADGVCDEDEVGLAAGLAGLSMLVSGRGTLADLLTRVAAFAVLAVPGADGAGVRMVDVGGPDTTVASAPFVRAVDGVQYRVGQGPCISAASTGRTTGSAALGEDAAWPRFGPLAAALGIHSALSLPLVLDGQVLGALNVYAYAREAFDGSSRRVGELFAGTAAIAVHNGHVLDQAQRAVVRLEAAVAKRMIIDQAVGIVMSRTGISADDAFLRLRIMSQRDHHDLSLIAQRLVDEAVRSARANTEMPPETMPPETMPPDTMPPDTAPPDTAPPDTAPPDTAPPDTAPPDTAPPATAPPDTAPPET